MVDKFEGEYRFLSNFWLAEIRFHGAPYKSNEHAYQTAKTLDPAERYEIMQAELPGRAKRLGQRVTLRPGWKQEKKPLMLELNVHKFTQHPDLRQRLVATYPHQLIEGNTWGDDFWGCVPSETRSQMVMRLWGPNREWAGENWLGVILMMVREVMR